MLFKGTGFDFHPVTHSIKETLEPDFREAPLPKMQLSNLLLVLAVTMWFSDHWGTAIVVEDFNHIERCKDSLYMGTPPRGFKDPNLKKICQRYADKPRFVTLYDPKIRIPVYSAYSFKKTEGDRRVDYPWMYEPQVWRSSLSVKTVKQKNLSSGWFN